MVRELNLGTVAQGKKVASKITLANVGINPLYIRRVIANDPQIKYTAPKSALKAGRKADLKLELNVTDTATPAQYSRVLTLITNDPNNPVINIKISWVVE